MSWKLSRTPIRPVGSEPTTSYIYELVRRLKEAEADIEVARYRRDLVFEDAKMHGFDRATVRRYAAKESAGEQ